MEARGVFFVTDGKGGGPIDVRLAFVGGRIDFRAVPDGVPIREELPDDAVEPSCFVGDLLGDFTDVSITNYVRLCVRDKRTAKRETLAAGVGLPALMLCLLVADGSITLCLLEPPVAILGGLAFVAVPFAFPSMRAAGFGVC